MVPEAIFWIISYCTSWCNKDTVHTVNKYAIKPTVTHAVKPVARVVKKVGKGIAHEALQVRP